ncbi:MAG TPA: hypothetical protein PK880_09020 [Candidatus Competibacter sp.]|nr:hypothetical protein [Candidatus Competibacter sp.]
MPLFDPCGFGRRESPAIAPETRFTPCQLQCLSPIAYARDRNLARRPARF